MGIFFHFFHWYKGLLAKETNFETEIKNKGSLLVRALVFYAAWV
jgi:hypothetical protein